jgi:hypothetical protein
LEVVGMTQLKKQYLELCCAAGAAFDQELQLEKKSHASFFTANA